MDKGVKHSVGSSRLVLGYHVASTIDCIQGQSIVLSPPPFQTSKRVPHCFFGFNLTPADLLYVVLSLNIAHLGIDVASEEKYLESCLLETWEKVESRVVSRVGGANVITAGSPLSLLYK